LRAVATAVDREALEEAVARGQELLKQGRLDDAQKAFAAALLLDDQNAKVLALLGLTYFRGGKLHQARPIYEDLVERLPTDASHRLNLGLVYLKLGDADKAIGSLEASRALDPSQGRAVSYLGLAYARAGRYQEAYRAFLLAGQRDLATEIEVNLTGVERDQIHLQLQRSGIIMLPDHAIPTPAPTPASSAEIKIISPAPGAPLRIEPRGAAPNPVDDEIRASDSVQFVLPTAAPVATMDGQTAISRAVEVATPASNTAHKVAAGSTPPVPLSQLATDELVRPDDGEDVFEVAVNGALIVRVTERIVTRLEGVHVTGGDLSYEPAMRRSRGHQTEEKFDHGGSQLHTVSGAGYLIALPGDRTFTAVTLDDDIFYLREDLVFAFEASLRWENGNVPGLRGKLPVVQFRGDGAVALRTQKPLVRIKLPPSGVVFVEAARLAGWIGRVIPRAVLPPEGGPIRGVCVECTGEGVVLLDPVGQPVEAAAEPRASKAPSVPPPPPPPAEKNLAERLGDELRDDQADSF
jgi:tetratricopeptide (TPR) repeat protein/uncharacterized protein (AIM24 family)